MERRCFVRVLALAGGGMLLGVGGCGREEDGPGGSASSHALGVYLAVGSDGTVTVTVPCPEIGQGVRTSLSRIVVEELGASWDRVMVRQAEADPKYGAQGVGGSDSVRDHWGPLRAAGAAAREMLLAEAASRWGVAASACAVREGEVTHDASGRRAAFGELASGAATRPVPQTPRLKDATDFRLVGRAVQGVDLPDVVRGTAEYGLDVRMPGLLRAVVARSPTPGARIRSVDDAGALAVPGVRRVVRIEPVIPDGRLYGEVRAGVAVVADDSWAAMRGRDALEVEWEEGRWASESSAGISARLRAALDGPPPQPIRRRGEPARIFRDAERVVEAEYDLPLLAHLCMEPGNFTARVRDGRCELEGPTQVPRALRAGVADVLGLPEESVRVRPTLAGGGFGRRLAYDHGVEAALVSRAVGAPVQVVWTREDSLAHDYFRPPSHHRLRAALDHDGRVLAWEHRIATASLLAHILEEPPGSVPLATYDVQGAADIPLAVPHVEVSHVPVTLGTRLGSWRSVSHSFNTFAVEAFAAEIAAARGDDPLTVRLELLGPPRVEAVDLPLPGRRGRPRPDVGRIRRVLERAAEAAGWGRALPEGWGRGLACAEYKGSFAAHVAEVSTGDGRPRVERVVAVLDCGRVVNPSGARAQVEGSVVDGVATCLHWGVRIRDGRPEPTNFHDQPLLRMHEAPEVEVILVESDRPPAGAGEPPYPSVVPAVASAWAAATGRPVRALPLS